MQKKNKATLALTVSAAGCLFTLPVASAGFGWGLLHHGFLAATIGGLADWFAVTALFRKPLGISYRTEILRRNRDRIMESIVTFSSDDLLSVENIMGVLRKQNTAALMVDYLQNRGGGEGLKAVVDEILLAAVNTMDTKAVAAGLEPAVREGLQSMPLEKACFDVFQLLSEEKHSHRMLHSLLGISRQVLFAPAMQQALLDNIKVLRREYEKDSTGRIFLLETLGLSDERILSIINEKLSHHLEAMQEGQTESYASLKAGLEAMFRAFGQDSALQDALGRWLEQYLSKVDLQGWMESWLEGNLKGEHPFWLAPLNRFIDGKLEEFAQREDWQKAFDTMVKNFIEAELVKHHDLIPGLIQERLQEFSDDDLTDFVESRVSDDLQMIRINGSIVGSLVGMGLYLVVWIAERLWGM